MYVYMHIAIQAKLELESITGEPSAVGDDASEMQVVLQLVAELRSQLQSVREETAEREKKLQDEVQRLGGEDHGQDRSTGQV